MVKQIICSISFAAISSMALAQSSSPEVIASGGDFFTGSNFTNSYTIGEMALVETYTTSGFILTQGFQQPADSTTGITPTTALNGFSVYPNPSNGNFSLQLQLDQALDFKIEVYDVLGKLLYTESQLAGLGLYKKDLNLASLESGVYFIRISGSKANGQVLATQPITITR